MRPRVPQRVELADPDLLGHVLESASWLLQFAASSAANCSTAWSKRDCGSLRRTVGP